MIKALRNVAVFVALVQTCVCCSVAFAQQYSAEKPLNSSAQSAPAYLKHAGIDQNLNSRLPLEDSFRDSSGATVALGSFFTHRPVVMAMVYYKCAMLCPQVLHGMAAALGKTGYAAGKDYDAVVTSIDPTDTPGDAAAAKQHFLSTLGNSAAAPDVHFLTGAQPEITRLANANGFHYVRVPGPDGKMTQFAHSSVIMIATPDGRLSKYLTGIEYQPRDLRLAILEASNHRIGSATDLILLYCCNYSPSEGRYTVSILRVLGLAALASVAGMIALLYSIRRKPRAAV
ncbi:MAG: SCO family protein [Acidobacteriaceae bacterium]